LTIPCDERRLYRNVCNWINLSKDRKETDSPNPDRGGDGLKYSMFLKPDTTKFCKKFDEIWKKDHVVPVCLSHILEDVPKQDDIYILNDEKGILGPIDTFPQNTYNYDLHLVLRDKENKDRISDIEILLNYHIGIEHPSMASWRCFLFPSTKAGSPYHFVKYLRLNILRMLHVENNLDKVKKLEDISNKLHTLEHQLSRDPNFVPNELASENFHKISITSGHPEIFNYSLVQITGFADMGKEEYNSVREALKLIPDLNELKKPLHNLQGVQRGLVWIPVSEWGKSVMDLHRNRDVIEWAKKIVYGSDAKEKQGHESAKKSINNKVVCIGWEDRRQDNLSSIADSIQNMIIKEKKEEDLYKQMRMVTLSGTEFSDVEIYSVQNATMSLATISKGDLYENLRSLNPRMIDNNIELPKYVKEANGLFPAQNYVSKFGLDRISILEKKMQDAGYDLYNIKNGWLTMGKDGDEKFLDIIPPVIEYSKEDVLGSIWIICDGMHRVYSAIKRAKNEINAQDDETEKEKVKQQDGLTVLAVWPKEESSWEKSPYYAYPCTWESVVSTFNKPPKLFTKQFRVKNDYFVYEMGKRYSELKSMLYDAKNFYRIFGDKDGFPFKIGNQGGE
jgi:hypothetical protein